MNLCLLEDDGLWIPQTHLVSFNPPIHIEKKNQATYFVWYHLQDVDCFKLGGMYVVEELSGARPVKIS